MTSNEKITLKNLYNLIGGKIQFISIEEAIKQPSGLYLIETLCDGYKDLDHKNDEGLEKFIEKNGDREVTQIEYRCRVLCIRIK